MTAPQNLLEAYREYYRLIARAARGVSVALTLSGDPADPDSDDALAFSIFCSAAEEYDPKKMGRSGKPVQFGGFLYRFTQFALAKESDRRGRGIVALEDVDWGVSDEVSPLDLLEEEELRLAVRRALDALPAALRARVIAVANGGERDALTDVALAAMRAMMLDVL